MNRENQDNFYLKNKKRIMRTFDAMLIVAKQVLVENFGEQKYGEMVATTHDEFETLLPHIPYIGDVINIQPYIFARYYTILTCTFCQNFFSYCHSHYISLNSL